MGICYFVQFQLGVVWFVLKSLDSQATWSVIVIFAAKFVILISKHVCHLDFELVPLVE